MLLTLFVSLAMLPTSALCAEWVKAAWSDGAIMYIDASSVKREGGKVRAWVLSDFSSLQTAGEITYMSSNRLDLFNCKESTSVLLAANLYSGGGGAGEMVASEQWSESEQSTTYLAPDSKGEAIMKQACALGLGSNKTRR